MCLRMSSSYTRFKPPYESAVKIFSATWRGDRELALTTIMNHAKTGGDLRQIFGETDSRVHAVAEFGNDLVSVVEDFAKANWMVATRTVVSGFSSDVTEDELRVV